MPCPPNSLFEPYSNRMENSAGTLEGLARGHDEASRQGRAAYTVPVHQLITPQAEAFFAGKMDLARLSFLDRMIIKAMKGQDEDLRDWDAIRAWAGEIANA